MSDEQAHDLGLDGHDPNDDDSVDIFDIGMFESGSDGSGFHIKNNPKSPYQRWEVIQRTGSVDIRCSVVDIVHGLMAPDSDYWATILVLRFRFDPQKRARRITEATIELGFDATDSNNELPEVEAISFDGNYSFHPSKQSETLTRGLEGTIGTSQVIDVSATAKWEKTVARETSDKTTVSGGKLVIDNIPPNRIAKWTLLENMTLKSGLPASIQVAVRIKRGDDEVFSCVPTITCKADKWTSIESLFSRVPKDDPLLLKPDSKPTNKLRVYDKENLGAVDLHELSAVVPTTMILSDEMGDHSSSSQHGLAQSEVEDRSPQTADSSDEELDHMEDDDTEDEGADCEEEQEEKENAELDAAATEDEQASDEEKTSDLFPPTPRVITVHGVRDDRNTAWTSRNGESWIRDRLFRNEDIRQMDYSYEIDDAARIFHRNGIDLEARALLESLARVRANDPEALINAILLQPEIKPDDDPDVGMDKLHDIYRKIPVLSSTMEQEPPANVASSQELVVVGEGPPTAEVKAPPASSFAAPFSRYTLTLFQPFELSGRLRSQIASTCLEELLRGRNTAIASLMSLPTAVDLDHLMLVRDLGLGEDWAEIYGRKFNMVLGFTIRNDYRYLQFQRSLLSLAPPTRITKVHFDPQSPRPPMMTWILEQQAFKKFSSPGARLLHLHTGGKSGLDIAAVSQHLSWAYNDDIAWYDPEYGSFYFEFDRRDGRYNNIKAMIASYLNSVCEETQRQMFMDLVLKKQSHNEGAFKIIVSTSGPDAYLSRKIADSNTINLEDCPCAVDVPYGNGTERPDTLDRAFQSLLSNRNALRHFDGEIIHLLELCDDKPHLGHTILQWLEYYGRGAPAAEIAHTLRNLSPITYQNVVRVFLDSSDEKKHWAKLVWRWVALAVEPLTTEMLAQAVALHISPDTPTLSDIDYDNFYQDLQRVFGGLITCDGRDIKFSTDALYDMPLLCEEEQDDTEQQMSLVHGEMARICLHYVLSTEGQNMLATMSVEHQGSDMAAPPLLLPRDSLMEYALRFWTIHYQASGKHRPVDAAMSLFRDTMKRRAWDEASYIISNPFTRIHRCYFSPLPYMAMLGLEDLVLMQIDNDKEASSFTRDCWLAITEAARNGHETMLNTLLSHVEADEAGLRETLHWAALYGKKEMLDILIAEAQKMENFQWPKYILTRAAAAGLDNLVSALADAGYDMNEEDASGTSMRAMHLAAQFGQDRVIDVMLAHGGADATLKNSAGQTPLRLAARLQAPETVQRLLLTDTRPKDDKDNGSSTLAQDAVNMGQYKSLEMLIEAGTDFQSGEMNEDNNRSGYRIPIVAAAGSGFPECVRILLEHGADPNAYSQQGSALYGGITEGPHIENCRMLLEKGANPNQSAADSDVYLDKEMLLLRAIATENQDLVSLLLEKGADINSVDPTLNCYETPLSYAVVYCSIEMVKLLLKWGADANFSSEKETSVPPLLAAVQNWAETSHEHIDLLVSYGANVHWKHKRTGRTPLGHAYDSPDHIRSLLKHGSDINAVDEEGLTTLIYAARYNCVESVRVLLHHMDPKPDLDIQDNNGWTALLSANDHGNVELFRLLLEAGADIHRTTYSGFDTLGLCLYNTGDLQVIELLLENGASVVVVDNFGDTVLHNIRTTSPVSTIKVLVEAGAPVDAVNNRGYTPLVIAVREGNLEAVKYLMNLEGVRVDVRHPDYGSILHMAVRSSSPLELTKTLIAAGADYTVNTESGESLLYTFLGRDHSTASKSAWNKMLRYLVEELHVDVNAHGGKRKYPILQLLKANHDSNSLKYLIRRGARIDVTDEFGRGPAHYAAIYGGRSMSFAPLIKAKADLLLEDNYGRTPLHFAAANNDGQDETWDPGYHNIDEGIVPDQVAQCLGCSMEIRGTAWRCVDCEENSYLCFKCQPHSSTMHDAGHVFRPDGEEANVEQGIDEEEDEDDEDDEVEDEEDSHVESLLGETDGSSADEPAANASVGSEWEDSQAEQRDRKGKDEDDYE
ncbi:hypothetical protein VMCG_04793 [Cytospora schulzeri]|uniref:Uncharacterized protein n=1 Tax=Cytospora schulzeri TaxID=448051 RepID=A0A423WMR4_9PEZI|nr:hypothetical protein VMCG_04793 [Valsa malicola]